MRPTLGGVVLVLLLANCSTGHPIAQKWPSPAVSPAAPVFISPSPPAPSPSATVQVLQAGQKLQLEQVQLFGKQGWATDPGDRSGGAILITDDAGATWRSVTPWPASQDSLFDTADFLGVNTAVVATNGTGPDGQPLETIWRTADRGRTWHQTPAGSWGVAGHDHFSFDSATDGWFLLPGQPASQDTFQGAQVWRTRDGGMTWSLVTSSQTFDPSPAPGGIPDKCGKSWILARDSLTAWVTGGCAGGVTFERTNDGGRTWRAEALPLGMNCDAGPCGLGSGRFLSPSFAYMLAGDYLTTGGSRTRLLVTYDGGSTWLLRNLPANPAGAVFVDQADGYSGSFYGSPPPGLNVTQDGGRTWFALAAATPQLFSVSCETFYHCWGIVAGGSGVLHSLVVTADGWAHWHYLAPVFV